MYTFCIRLKVFMETFYKMFGVMLCRREKCWNRSKMKIVYTSRNISSQLLRLPRACVRSLTIQNEVKCVCCVCVSMYNARAHNESFCCLFAKIVFACAMTTKTNMFKAMDLICKLLPRMPRGNTIYIYTYYKE